MKSVHRMVHQADRSDGTVEWACPQCGRYTMCHPSRQRIVVVTGEANSVHVPGAGFPPDPDDIPSLSDFDQRWLYNHQMVW